MKYFFLITTLLSMFLSNCFAQQISNVEEDKIIQCWRKAYHSLLNFTERLIEFEMQLLDKKILKDNSIDSYLLLFDEVTKKEVTKKWHQVMIPQYISAGPFKHCMRTHKPSKENLAIRHWVFLFSIYHILSLDYATIGIRAYGADSIAINGIIADMNTFKQVFKVELDVMKKQDIPLEEIIVNVLLDEQNMSTQEILSLKKKIDDYDLTNVTYK